MPYYTANILWLMFWNVSITHLYGVFCYFSSDLFGGSYKLDTWYKAPAMYLQPSIPIGYKWNRVAMTWERVWSEWQLEGQRAYLRCIQFYVNNYRDYRLIIGKNSTSSFLVR
jgi:hypothetical protein